MTEDKKNDVKESQMILEYLSSKEEINIFNNEFVSRTSDMCYLIIDGEKIDLCAKYKITPDKKKEIILVETTTVTDMSSMFDDCSALISVKSADWDSKNVTNMSYMFNNCINLLSVEGLKNFDVSSVESMSYMFSGCYSLKSLKGLEKWNTAQLSDMSYMLNNCSELESIKELENWNISNVTDLSHLFGGCKKLESVQELKKWDTTNVNNLASLFENCESLTSLKGIENWITTSVNDLSLAFCNCESLKSIEELENWDVSNCMNMSNMLSGCSKLTSIKGLEKWNTCNLFDMNHMLSDCSSLLTCKEFKNWDISNVTNLDYLFINCSSLTSIEGLEDWNTASVTDIGCIFNDCSSLTSILSLKKWNTSNITNMDYVFNNCTSLLSVEGLEDWDTSHVENMSYMFNGCYKIKSFSSLENWNTLNVTNMSQMFSGCSALENLKGLEKWDTLNVTDMYFMFSDCTKLESIKELASWNISNCTNLSSMFEGCTSLKSLEGLENWNTGSVNNMSSMFEDCSSLTSVKAIKDWNIINVSDLTQMFSGCSGLSDIQCLENWKTENVSEMTSMFNGTNIYSGPNNFKYSNPRNSRNSRNSRKSNFSARESTKVYLNQRKPKIKEKYKDYIFPPDIKSLLGKDTKNETSENIDSSTNEINADDIEWKRAKLILPEPHLFENEIDFKNVSPGIISNIYFLSAIAALCKYPFLISKIFITKDCKEYYYKLSLYIDGEFQVVYLDDFFPCIKGTNIPYFSKSNSFELWIMLLEKAWAKINHGYGNILQGNPSDIFKVFTGFCCEQLDHKHDNIEKIWEIYKNSYNNKDVICVSTGDAPDLEQVGLIPNYTYILTDIAEVKNKNNELVRLCKLKNPLGNIEWKGEWGNQSDSWTDDINKQIDENILKTNKDDCFMSFNDLIKNFIRGDICHILFNANSKSFEFHQKKGLNEPQVFNLSLKEKGNISISVIDKNPKFLKEFENISHPTSLIIAEYDTENKCFKNIYSDYESYKDIEKTLSLNQGNYLVWIYKGVNESEVPKPDFMKVKFISDRELKIKHVCNDSNFDVVQTIIYQGVKKDKQNEINNSEIFYETKNEFQKSGLAYKLVINPLSTCYQKWNVDTTETKDFIILPPFRGQNNFILEVGPNDYGIILALRNKKYGEFCFNVKVEAEQYECKDGENISTTKKGIDFDKYCLSDLSSFDPANKPESGSFEDLSHKDKFPTFDLPKIFADKYKKECDYMNEVIKMEPTENEKKLRWAKIEKDNGTYFGEAYQNLPEGRGCFVYKGDNELKWIGYFKDGTKGNYGKLYNKDGKLIYEGEYKDGFRNGEGKYYYSNGDRYEGQFVKGIREGHGTFFWKDGKKWEGLFEKNEMNGQGTYYDGEKNYPVTYNKGNVVH